MRNDDFALLCGRAFLYELDKGRIDSAIAFGRAFLISLGAKDVGTGDDSGLTNGKAHGDQWISAEN